MSLPKPTVYGLVQTLLREGFLCQSEATRKYSVGLKVIEMGAVFAGNLKINQVAGELVQRLALNTGLNGRIAVWDSDSMLITLNLFPAMEFSHFQQVGPRVPAYCTAIGKAVLSTFDEADLAAYLNRSPLFRFTQTTITDQQLLHEDLVTSRELGYAQENGEFLLGLSCIAVPVFDGQAEAVGAISLSGTPQSLSDQRQTEVVSLLIQTGYEVSRRMGYRPEMVLASK